MENTVEMNRTWQLNLGTFNVPTIVGLLAIFAMVYSAGGKQQEQETRLNNIELARAARSAEVNKVLEALQTKIDPMENIKYRLTTAENAIIEANRRMDRMSDSTQDLRNNVNQIATSIQLLNQKFDSAFPSSPGKLPAELRGN